MKTLAPLTAAIAWQDLMERYPPGSDVCFKKKPSNVDSGIAPDWFLKPSEVWEIRGADISLSCVPFRDPVLLMVES